MQLFVVSAVQLELVFALVAFVAANWVSRMGISEANRSSQLSEAAAFEHFLKALNDSDPDKAGREYIRLRERLRHYFPITD